MSKSEPLTIGVELGGTKCIAVLARGRKMLDMRRWPTEASGRTLQAISDRLSHWQRENAIEAMGIASFGPLCLDTASPKYGHIVNTPKPGWSGVDVLGILKGDFAGPVGFDTDVAGAALAEGRWGAASGCRDHVYLTIGTGIGAGIVANGELVHGKVHPEVGHIRVRRDRLDDFPGLCPMHGDCIEGLASGPAITARAGEPVDHLAIQDPVWELVAGELAELMISLILTLSPQRIVIGGGVAERRPMLFAMVHAATAERLAGYLDGQMGHELQRLIVPPLLGTDAGPLGANALALVARDTILRGPLSADAIPQKQIL